MSGAGVRPALTFCRLVSFKDDGEDSHIFEVDALLSASVVTGEGKEEVEAEAIGNDVTRGAGCPARESRSTLLMAGCDLGLGGVLLSLSS